MTVIRYRDVLWKLADLWACQPVGEWLMFYVRETLAEYAVEVAPHYVETI